MHVQFSVRERNEKDRMAHIHPKWRAAEWWEEWSEKKNIVAAATADSSNNGNSHINREPNERIVHKNFSRFQLITSFE